MIPGIRKLAAVATLVVLAGLPACDVGGSPAFRAYKDFVRAGTRGDCDTLYALAEQDAIAFADYLCKRRSMTFMGKTVDLGSIASNVASIRPSSTPFNDPISMEWTIESETRSSDKRTVDLVVLEKSFQGHGGERKPTWLRRHTATVQLRDGKWRLTRFREEILQKYD